MNVINGDCLTEMAKMESNSISGIVTDPPYGISFMNKGWDHGVPGEEYWKEALRVCKPGSHLLAFGGTRTYHRLACAIEDAGWEIRDCISWLYGSGFPKSHNHFGLPGYGTALKPAWEPIIMAMKPCEGTFKENAEKYGQAGINIDGCRIGTETTTTHSRGSNTSFAKRPGERLVEEGGRTTPQNRDEFVGKEHPGRWPANLILDEEAAALLDEQSGTLKSGKLKPYHSSSQGYNGGCGSLRDVNSESNSGGASRFFYVAKASSAERNRGCEGLETKPCATLGNYATNSGYESSSKSGPPQKNNHPTVKPLKLMEYLITLIAPPKDAIILDPFMGSGTTLLACQNLGINCIGIELSAEYCEIAKARFMGNETLFSPKAKFV